MTKNPQSKDDALEALDFIVNVLKEHERDLDKLINELATVTEQIGDTGELNGKVEKVEEKINNLQKEVTNLVSCLSSNQSKEAATAPIKIQPTQTAAAPTPTPAPAATALSGPSVAVHCKQWEDFQSLAFQAQRVSFTYKDEEKAFQADALKGNQIITYTGPLPKFSVLMKASLSKQLDVPERNILEGVLAIS